MHPKHVNWQIFDSLGSFKFKSNNYSALFPPRDKVTYFQYYYNICAEDQVEPKWIRAYLWLLQT